MGDEEELESRSDQYKDSCKYSVDISKQFLTLSSGGVAFVVGLAMASSSPITNVYYLVAILFILSIACGLIFVMSVVAHINQDRNYDVYTSTLKIFAGIQMANSEFLKS